MLTEWIQQDLNNHSMLRVTDPRNHSFLSEHFGCESDRDVCLRSDGFYSYFLGFEAGLVDKCPRSRGADSMAR